MSVVVPHRAIEIVSRSSDVRKSIRDTVGDLSDIEVMGDMVLIGVYIRPERTVGGIIRPTVNVQEDVWQGKVGLVLKLGSNAFVDPTDGVKYEDRVEAGDWCLFKVGDGWSFQLRDYPCRLVRDVNIRGKVKDPSIIL